MSSVNIVDQSEEEMRDMRKKIQKETVGQKFTQVGSSKEAQMDREWIENPQQNK